MERADADRWFIPEDFEARAAAYEAARGRQTQLRVLCAYDLDRQVTSDGATWLDRQLVGRDRGSLATGGFGAARLRLTARRIFPGLAIAIAALSAPRPGVLAGPPDLGRGGRVRLAMRNWG